MFRFAWVGCVVFLLWLPLMGCGVGGLGSIQVSSTPPGASIVLDETDSGLTTPATLNGIIAGFHTIRLKLAMEADWGPKSVQVVGGKTVLVGATLRYPGGLVFLPAEQYNAMPPLRPTNAPAELPPRVDLKALFPPPGDQGLTQTSCVGWAVGYGLKSYQERLDRGWSLDSDSHRMSPAFIYNQIKEPGGGALLYKALELVLTEGDSSLATMPYDPLSSTALPSHEAVQEAEHYRISRWSPINQGSVFEMKSFLAEGVPIVAGIRVYPDFRDLDQDNPIYDNDAGERMMDHAVVIIGYDDDRAAFEILNSWGTSWGIGGYGWIAYDFSLSVIQEAYVAQDAEGGSGKPG